MPDERLLKKVFYEALQEGKRSQCGQTERCTDTSKASLKEFNIPTEPCVCVYVLTISNMNMSKTMQPIVIKFYLKHHWGGGKPAKCFGPDRIRTLVSMATDSSHRVLMGKTASISFLGCFGADPFHTFSGNDGIRKK